MGACESGLVRTELSAEYTGLPSVFLSAGVRYVIGSLWEVENVPTIILLCQFYELVGTGTYTITEALNAAERSLAKMTSEEALAWCQMHFKPETFDIIKSTIKQGTNPYAHPYYWAGFCVSGDV